ncbi:unnamed protein product [Rotaria socialis]|uniref:Reverse transcriptase domain-containing protein n=1 Tax=Rotaria socialis TaxID=392032 RepID=A0A820V0M3_9BILA|nr:unnamed protein product [Rotaria socialis]CAF4769802.1 unnamed protein product [Rotaria socialis]
MAGLKSPTMAIFRWLDGLLRSLFNRLANETTILNGSKLVKQIEQWSARYLTSATSFITMDVTDLYTMIPQEGGVKAIRKLMEASNINQIDSVKKEIILALARFVMTNNCFYLDGLYYKQIRGGAMGSPFTLIVANAYMYFVERPISKWAIRANSLYYRYIDDLFIMSNVYVDTLTGFVNYWNKFDININLSASIGHAAEYLDLKIENRGEGKQELRTNNITQKQLRQKRQSLGTNLNDPYYAYNPDYMGGNMPNVQLYQNNVNNGQQSSCTCNCGEMSYGPPVICTNPQTCVAYCLQMYPGQCTLINTYGCCGSSCKYFQSQSLQNRFCTCNCGGQQFFNPTDTCSSSQSCLILCRSKYPQTCMTITTEACCGTDCQTYSQAIANTCACQCHGYTYYPSPRCSSPERCINICMTTYGTCTVGQTQGCCGASCSSYIPTCTCRCGSNFIASTSVPCQKGRNCLETCMSSYSACTEGNTRACCGADCANSYLSCSCLCGTSQNIPLNLICGSPQQCAQACVQSVRECNIANTQGCCGGSCYGYIPSCKCQCGGHIYYTPSTCNTAEQCTNACIIQYGYTCTPINTIGCCNGTVCTRRNRFLGVSKASTFLLSHITIVLLISYYFVEAIAINFS